MPDEPTTPPAPEQPETPPAADPETPPEPPKADPWADPEAARKEIEKLRKEAASYRTRAKDLEPLAKKAKELEDAQKSEQQRLAEQLAAEQERASKAVRTAVEAKVQALAAGTFTDPTDPVGELDLASFVGDDGAIDEDGIKAALGEVLKRKPHWAKAPDGPRRPAPDRTQGSSGNGARTQTDPATEFAAFLKQGLTRGH